MLSRHTRDAASPSLLRLLALLVRVLDEIRDVNLNALLKDTENKKFISAQLHKKLAAAGLTAAAAIAVVFAAMKSGDKPAL